MNFPYLRLTWPIRAFTVILIVAIWFGCTTEDSSVSETIVVFKHVNIVNPADGLSQNMSVVVRGKEIVDVASAESVDVPADARVIDGEGKYLIPGLWDAHIHVTNSAIHDPDLFPLYILNGITYLRDTSAILDEILPLRDRAAAMTESAGMAPDLYISGPHIEGLQPSWESSVSAGSVDEALDWMEELIEAGVDEIKLYELLPREIYLAVLERAQEEGVLVSAHVPLTINAIEASNAGLNSIEHLNNLEYAMSSDYESMLEERRRLIEENPDLSGNELRGLIHGELQERALRSQDPDRRREVIETLARNGTWQVPTLVVSTYAVHQMNKGQEWAESFRFLPADTREEWTPVALEDLAEPTELEQMYADWAYGLVPDLAEAGVGIMAGTDAPLFELTPAYSLHAELVLLVEAGLSPLEAIEAATLAPARYFGLEAEQGTIAEGLRADLVLLDANPLEDISHTQRVHTVLFNGFLHTREDLDRIEQELENR